MADSPAFSAPRKMLLATDLSARCDRALERAIMMAADWKAQLTIVHVFEEPLEAAPLEPHHTVPSWRRPPDAISIAKYRIRKALRADLGDAVESAVVLVEEGDPAEVVERIATEQGSGLIVTAIAREVPFALMSVTLGKTVERLLRRSAVPILIVRNRARAPYSHILVATDFSDSSAHALQAALRLFPSQTLRLLHAFDAPYSGLIADPAKYEEGYGDAVAGELQTFLASIFLPEEERRRLVPLIERGPPAQLVRDYVRENEADLVVLGTHGRSAILEALVGSTAKSILSTLPCDALVMRGPRGPV